MVEVSHLVAFSVGLRQASSHLVLLELMGSLNRLSAAGPLSFSAERLSVAGTPVAVAAANLVEKGPKRLSA